ncbi:response regulator [Ralstonia flatus]|uniref:histidine kinase n=1 Tax=Ralstonia flatus TaxID=3058601 RepID=A0AAD2F6S5_9RALS|nr:response regulator [Ralstonia sp. LMG 32965]MBN6208274.1 response regulator [Ralstonia pickettii]CAJ0894159.1 Sensor histidine kinase RcsC [Ralstonia sp. LMG 32965]CAJ0903692.1 Sensor histidine kinase RcsC [Ralstonia sp. LMG 32965]
MPFLAHDHDCLGWSGEMAQRVLAFDWASTELGPIEDWPPSLRAAVQMVLASPVPLVMLWGRHGYMVYNDAYAEFAGGRHPYLLGCPVELGWPEVADFNRHVMDVCLGGGTLSYRDKELVLLRNGRPEDVWMDLYYSPLPDDHGSPAGVLAIVVETTERVLTERERQAAEQALRQLTETLEQRVADALSARAEVEAQLRQAQKMEAIGNLTGGVAHDFNNVLQVIAGNLQMLTVEAPGNARVQHRVAAATRAVQRGATLAAQLLAFARRQPLSPAIVNPTKLVQGMSEMLHRALGEAVKVETHLAEDLWHVQADRNQLENALLNLAINARDAMRGGGVLTIAANNVTLDSAQAQAQGRGQLTPGDYLVFSVTDTGVGMPPEVVEHVFEPFFTTKPDGHGTGLGLSMVFGFVKQSGGHIAIDSAVGRGTTVQLYFPRSTEAAPDDALDLRDTVVTPMGGRETILVVEDDTDVRLTAVDMLTQLGYRVLTAANGEAALELMNSGTPIDLLFTDVIMPGPIKGGELSIRAAQRVPPLPVLLVSGYTRDEILRDGRLPPGVTLLDKPYRRDDLARMVRNVLNNSRTGQAQGQVHPTSTASIDEAATAVADTSPPPTVLLVEDDAGSREAMQEVLTTFGLQCLAAASAEDALAIARTQPVQVLLTDLTLPGQSGAELARTLQRQYPDMDVLLMTGYGTQAEIGEPIPGACVLAKPVDLTLLHAALAPWLGTGVNATTKHVTNAA